METGFRGTFVISWSQTEVDGLRAAPRDALGTGVSWAWRGEAVRIDGPGSVLRLGQADQRDHVRQRAGRRMRQIAGTAPAEATPPDMFTDDDPLFETDFVVSDGRLSHAVTLIERGPGAPPLLMFVDTLPPQGTELWVVQDGSRKLDPAARPDADTGVICFTPGTRIATPDGPCPVEQLSEGDRVQTRDSGAQEILWIGRRRISGARLFIMPHLRPIRIGPGALGIDRPDNQLLVSPAHRLLVRRPSAQALFNTSEVLVQARDLVNGGNIAPDLSVCEVTYIHLMLPRHEVLWANGVETDSFHPLGADLEALSPEDRARLHGIDPALPADPARYGGFARRALTGPETAILMHDAA